MHPMIRITRLCGSISRLIIGASKMQPRGPLGPLLITYVTQPGLAYYASAVGEGKGSLHRPFNPFSSRRTDRSVTFQFSSADVDQVGLVA